MFFTLEMQIHKEVHEDLKTIASSAGKALQDAAAATASAL